MPSFRRTNTVQSLGNLLRRRSRINSEDSSLRDSSNTSRTQGSRDSAAALERAHGFASEETLWLPEHSGNDGTTATTTIATLTPLDPVPRLQLAHGANSASSERNSQLNSPPRTLTDEESKCLQLFRLTQSDRDVSYEWYKSRVEERVENTCQWFLRHEHYQSWLEKDSGPLLVTADPGCGKSVLAKYLTDHGLPTDSTICYFFFKDQDQNTVAQALCALLHQLFCSDPDLIRYALKACRVNGSSLVKITSELSRIFEAVVKDVDAGPIIIVLDALDECEPSEFKKLMTIWKRLFSGNETASGAATNQLKCLMTSRPYEQVAAEFRLLTNLFPRIRIPGEEDSDTIRDEVSQVIYARVDQFAVKRNLSEKLKSHLLTKLMAKENRTYLWVYLVFEYLEEESFRKTERGLDESLDTLPGSVSDAYETILNRSTQDSIVEKALAAVLAAVHPLTVAEMNIAVHVDGSQQAVEDMDLEDKKDFELRLRSSCGLILSVHHNRVYFLHQTAREFLLYQRQSASGRTSSIASKWQGSFTIADAQSILAQSCMFYLGLFDYENLPPDGGYRTERGGLPEDVREATFPQYALLGYASNYWSRHLHFGQRGRHFASLLAYLDFKNGYSKKYWDLFVFYHLSEDTPYCPIRPEIQRHQLHFAAIMDHENIAKLLLDQGEDVESYLNFEKPPKFGASSAPHPAGTPICYAAAYGSTDVLKLLINRGANVNAKASDECQPLGLTFQALIYPDRGAGVATNFQLLLDSGADVHTRWCDETSLIHAARYSLAAPVRALLEQGVGVHLEDDSGQTALFNAAATGEEIVVQLILDAGADPDHRDKQGQSALFVVNGVACVRRLLQAGAHVDLVDNKGNRPLLKPLEQRDDAILQELVRAGADINSEHVSLGSSTWVAVSDSSTEWSFDCLRLLIASGVDVTAQDAKARTPLHIAAHCGLSDSVKHLLEAGAAVDAVDMDGDTPLLALIASHRGAERTASMRLLLEAGANVNAKGSRGTPLLVATHCEWHDGIELLLSAGPDLSGRDRTMGTTALHVSAQFGLHAILGMLLKARADINVLDDQGATALDLAEEAGEEDCVRILVEAGAKLK